MSYIELNRAVITKWCLQAMVLLLILLGTLAGIARMALPLLEDYHTEIESIAENILQRPVRIGAIDTAWSGWNPVIVMYDAYMESTDSGDMAIDLKELDISFDLIASIFNRELQPERISMKVGSLAIHRQKDGRISLGFDALLTNGNSRDAPENLQWLLEQPDVHIFAEAIEFRDKQAQLPDICLQDASMSLETRSGSLLLQFVADACAMAERIEWSAELPHADFSRHSYSARAYLKIKQASLPFWKEALSKYVSLPDQGIADIQLWVDIGDGEPVKIEGNASLSSVVYEDAAGASFRIASMRGNFSWQRSHAGWQLQIADWSISRHRHHWPASGLLVTFNEDRRQYDVKSRYLRMDDVLPVIMMQPWVRQNLDADYQALNIGGSVADLNLRLILDDGFYLTDYTARARLEGFSVYAGKNVPAIYGVDGYLLATSRSGLLDLQAEDVLLDMETLFRDPLDIGTLTGRLHWSVLDSGVLIESSNLQAANAHIATQSRLSIHLAEGRSPLLDIQTEFENGDGAYVSRYLPARIMPAAATDWLDNGIVAGQVDSGTLVLQGHVDDFPYDEQEGRFEVRFNIRGGTLNYYDDWPRIEEIAAEVQVLGRHMRIEATASRIRDADLKRVVVDIEDMGGSDPVVKVNGFAEVSSHDLLGYLSETSLIDGYQRALSVLYLSGRHNLHLDMSLPLARDELELNGVLDFRGNRLSIPDWQIELSDLKGRLFFSDKAFRSQSLTADYLGRAVASEVSTISVDGRRETHIRLQTRADLSRLLAQKIPLLAERIQGESAIDVTIQTFDDLQSASRLIVHSDLKGTEICLPAPFIKPRQTTLPLRLVAGLGNELTVQASLQDRAQVRMKFNEKGGLSSGMLYLGASQAPLDPEEGIFAVRGRLDELELDNWVDWYDSSAGNDEEPYFDLPVSLDLDIGSMALSKWYLSGFGFSGLLEDDSLDMSFSGYSLTGTGVFDRNQDSSLELKFDAMRIREEPDVVMDNPDDIWSFDLLPSDIPSLDIDIERLFYNNRDIGNIGFSASSGSDELRVTRAYLRNEKSDVDMEGSWQYRRGEHRTKVDINVASTDFGDLMRRLGYHDTIRQGAIDSQGSFSAPLSPLELGIEDISGEIEVAMRDGEVIDIDSSNAGRVFGLLSFQALPRRLSLDFSDLFSQGISFDEIRGHFEISQGDAYTSNLMLTAPSGTVEIAGRVGLFDRDYDQLVKVIPNVSASLPVVGALAGISGWAAALWLADQVLGEPLNKLAETEYRISGIWDDPKIEKLTQVNEPAGINSEE